MQISQIASLVDVHANTIDNWFKQLQAKGLHYVNRDPFTGVRQYDELDFAIATHIKKLRDEGTSLSAIFDGLSSQFHLRLPIVEDLNDGTNEPVSYTHNLTEVISYVIEDKLEGFVYDLLGDIKKVLNGCTEHLSQQATVSQHTRLMEFITIQKIQAELEEHALHMWSKKPISQRLKRVGVFKKEEDCDARDKFVKDYVDRNLEKCIKIQFNLTEK